MGIPPSTTVVGVEPKIAVGIFWGRSIGTHKEYSPLYSPAPSLLQRYAEHLSLSRFAAGAHVGAVRGAPGAPVVPDYWYPLECLTFEPPPCILTSDDFPFPRPPRMRVSTMRSVFSALMAYIISCFRSH